MGLSNGSQLKKIARILKDKISTEKKLNYAIPQIWNSFNYAGPEKQTIDNDLISVNPYSFYYECIEKEILPHINDDINYNLPFSKISNDTDEKPEGYVGGDWIRKSSIYSLHIRTTASWDHNGSGQLEITSDDGFRETGTFLKTLALLPMLKKLGMETLYILPVFKNSDRYTKGELASPYSVKNFFELDEMLKDPMLGDEITVNQEFGAFVEACHALGLKVIIDFVPRTSARDSELILDHPDWFYWVPIEEIPNYSSPEITNVREEGAKGNLLPFLYSSPNVIEHLNRFCESPDKLYPDKWKALKEYCKQNPSADFFAKIEQELGVTTAPGFCDNAEDTQSPWTDISYFKMYFDHPPKIRTQLKNPDTQAPYILYDIVKCNDYPGEVKNQELWDLLANVVPFFQKQFGVDGVRIDMGHSLPKELELMIIEKAREIDPECCFITELFDAFFNQSIRQKGYNMFAGDLWYYIPRLHEFSFHEFYKPLEEQNLQIWIPIFGCAETADSPRAAARAGGRKFSRLTAVLNYFMPNAVPFIFSGFEIYEMQPMNVDLDTEGVEGRACMLPESDPFYGKLPFFDRYALHWTADGSREIIQIITKVKDIRKKYLSTLIDAKNCVPVHFNDWDARGIALGYIIDGKVEAKGNLLMIVANLDYQNSRTLEMNLAPFREKSGNTSRVGEILYSEFIPEGTMIESFDEKGDLSMHFEPGEIKIFTL